MAQEFQDIVRYHINRYIFDRGHAPNVQQLAQMTASHETAVQQALDELVANHALVLHPNSYNIWVAHPFSLMPTLFWVESERQQWYSNCTWCSLGVASLVEEGDVTIYTKLNGTRSPLEIHIRNGQVVEDHLLVHFVVPMTRIWDNVIYTCSNMLAFESTEAIDQWCQQQHVERGDVQPIKRIWDLARKWYGYYLSPQWTRKTREEAAHIFQSAGLTGDFWKV